MRIDRTGCSRVVILTKRYAWKLPNFLDSGGYRWKSFLTGLLANMQEVTFAKTGWPELCPIDFALPLGFLVVMPRAELLTEDEFDTFDADRFLENDDYCVPAEKKANSFGWLSGRIVAIDYGN